MNQYILNNVVDYLIKQKLDHNLLNSLDQLIKIYPQLRFQDADDSDKLIELAIKHNLMTLLDFYVKSPRNDFDQSLIDGSLVVQLIKYKKHDLVYHYLDYGLNFRYINKMLIRQLVRMKYHEIHDDLALQLIKPIVKHLQDYRRKYINMILLWAVENDFKSVFRSCIKFIFNYNGVVVKAATRNKVWVFETILKLHRGNPYYKFSLYDLVIPYYGTKDLLMLCVNFNSFDVLVYLIESGLFKNKALDAFEMAIYRNNCKIVEYMKPLIREEFVLNDAFRYVCNEGYRRMAELIIDFVPNPKTREQGFRLAAGSGQMRVLKYLHHLGVDHGDSLIISTFNNQMHTTKFLLKHYKKSLDPVLDQLISPNHKEMILLLKESGAKPSPRLLETYLLLDLYDFYSLFI